MVCNCLPWWFFTYMYLLQDFNEIVCQVRDLDDEEISDETIVDETGRSYLLNCREILKE